MTEMVAILIRGARVAIAARPVSLSEYMAFLRATERRPIPAMTRVADRSVAATHVSQYDAVEYCRWLTGTGTRVYRLPRLQELLALSCDENDGSGCAEWARINQGTPGYWGVDRLEPLCEWTAESRSNDARQGGAERQMGAIFYPPWVRSKQRILHSSGWLMSNEGYSFVGFRVASDQV